MRCRVGNCGIGNMLFMLPSRNQRAVFGEATQTLAAGVRALGSIISVFTNLQCVTASR
jgi:hypothetical protein